MKSRVSYYLLFGAILVSVGLAIVTMTARAIYPEPSMTPPAPPTPGPPPTPMPRTEQGNPVADRDEAIERVLAIDAVFTLRERPLTQQTVETTPDLVIVKSYTTREQASEVHGGGGLLDPSMVSEPVWVVMIKGKAPLRVLGGGKGVMEVDRVTYTISQRDGSLLAISGGIRE